jgi:hypothetical protein
MSNLQFIESTLGRAARRQRWERAFRGLWQGFFIGALAWLVALVVYKLLPVPVWTLGVGAGCWAVASLAGFVIGGWKKLSISQAARWVDGKQHLQERLSTALEFSKQGGVDENWKELVVTDAASHAKEVDPKKLVQFRLPKVARWAVVIVALSAGLGFVPEYRSKAYVQKKTEENVIKEAGRQLAGLTKRSLDSRKPALETTQKSMEAVKELGDQL